jgi:hypothetical protein
VANYREQNAFVDCDRHISMRAVARRSGPRINPRSIPGACSAYAADLFHDARLDTVQHAREHRGLTAGL